MTSAVPFTHLHVHSEYSLLDGMCKIPALAQRTRELGMDALALTDHGVLYGAVQFYLACRDAGVKPILGIEGYVAPGDHRSKTAADRDPSHVILLAKNETGWRNLIRLTTRAHLDGFYYKPRADHELLAAHSEGLIALSGCLNAEVPKLILQGRMEEARETAQWYREVFGDYFLELQKHQIPELDTVNRGLVELGRELGIPLVATNDAHYVHRENQYAHDVLLCIQTNSTVHDEKRLKLSDDSYYIKSPEEMAAAFADVPEAVAMTERVAALCDLTLNFNRLYLPEYKTPRGQSPDEYVAELCWEGVKRRYGDLTESVEQRLRYELDVIQKTQFANYFLVVWDFVKFSRERGILYGVRGSAAASVVLYCLGITDIDPLEFKLVFERFLNVERKEMPDIDMDFADDRRDEVIAYVANKYGHDHVAQIITFGTLGAKAAIRDVGRALGVSYSDVDRVARLVPAALHITIDRALEESGELAGIYRDDQTVRSLVDTARELEGTARHASTHAAGVLISQEPLTDLVPLQRPSRAGENAIVTTQWPMEDVARIGLLKMDFLGLINLTILGKARDLIRETAGVELDLLRLPLDDARTYDLLASAETTGVFQLESGGMRRAIKELKPQNIGEIAALVALYRPGPMQHIPTYIAAKHGREKVRFPHPALAEILEDTYGVIVYQDQVLHILRHFAGYSLGQADIVRKAMGKKIAELMQAERQHFLQGALAKGFSEEEATQVFDLIEPFAGYAFNKAHATSYAMVAYQTAYLKANYPAEYMAAFMTCFSGSPERLSGAVGECGRLGVRVLPPDINQSDIGFSVTANPAPEPGPQPLAIRFGLEAIKNVGTAALEGLLASRREAGPFTSVEDFCRRADLRGINKRALESLIKAGALDCLGPRGGLLAGVDRIIGEAQQQQRLRESGQSSMFDLWGEAVAVPLPGLDISTDDVPLREKLAWENELLGVYLSEHPFSAVVPYVRRDTTALCGEIDEERVGEQVTVAGIVASVRTLNTREGRPFAAAVLEDLWGRVEVTVWPETFQETRDLWSEGELLLVRGKVTNRRDAIQIVCEAAERYAPEMSGPGEEDQGAAAEITGLEETALSEAEPEDLEQEWNSPGLPHLDQPASASAEAGVEQPAVGPRSIAEPAHQALEPARPSPVPPRTGAPPPPPRVLDEAGSGPGKNGNGARNAEKKQVAPGAKAPGPGRTGVSIHLYESEDPERDLARFQSMMDVLNRHRGSEPVRLTIVSGGTAMRMELPVRIALCTELVDELRAVIGESGLELVEEPQ